MNKIAIVLSGGGMRCAYSAGAILALVDKYNLTKPDIVIGASGCTGTLAYFASGQYNSIRNIWTNLLCCKEFISFFRFWRIMDIDYLIDEISKKEDRLNMQNIKLSEIDFYIIVTDKETGETTYFTKDNVDIFEALRASSAIPIFFNKSVTINGRQFIDGSMLFNIEDGIKLAQDLGAKKIIAINNRRMNWCYKTYYLFWALLHGNFIKELRGKKFKFDNDENVFLLDVSNKLKMNILDNNQKKLKETMSMGYSDVIDNKQLEEFLLKGKQQS